MVCAPSTQSIPSISSIQSTPAELPISAATQVILVRGANGEPEFAPKFDAQLEAWKKVAATAGAQTTVIHEGSPAAAADPKDTKADEKTAHGTLKKALTALPPEGPGEIWIVMMGHGTWDGKEARFNLEGPDVSATELAEWLKPVRRPLVVINTASCSAPFLNALAGADRIVITAVRSGSEKNYTRFGEYLAASLTDPAADYDQDKQWSLLEWFLSAAARTAEFYKTEGRIATEHALIDDNGDGKGTPAEWFQGLRAVKKTRDAMPLDGAAAQRLWLVPDDGARRLTPDQLAERGRLETEIAALRARKSSLKEDDYYQLLETLMRRLAAVYEPGS
ncbi:MAG: hypothetical protein EOP86_12900 [Verrucomicrobiaceae bacterium]|nr:MAG: hypothetical protein EOP86_12900 [Verrucomicrobiaceae bacterium]